MKKSIFLMGIALFVLSPFFVCAQLLDPVKYTLTEMPDTVKAGQVFEVTVEASIDKGWHLYSILNDPGAGPYPTQFSTPIPEMVITGDIEESEAEIAFDPNFQTDLGWHSNTAQFTIPIAFNSDLQGTQTLILEVLYQVCDDRSCLPPKTKQIEGKIFLSGVSDSPFETNVDSNEISILWILVVIIFTLAAWLVLFFAYRLHRKKVFKNKSTG